MWLCEVAVACCWSRSVMSHMVMCVPCLPSMPAVNIAQHSYFNLAGHDSGSTILDHKVWQCTP